MRTFDHIGVVGGGAWGTALACLACRLALRAFPVLLRLLFVTLVYLVLAAILLAAVLAMLAFHSIACISGNVP